MQNFNLDISQPRGPLVLYASQGDSLSRFFAVTVTDNGAAYEAPSGAIYTVRFGAPGMPAGWYDTITEVGGATRPAVVANENTFTVEIAEQAVGKPGKNKLVLIISDAVGYTLATWDFELQVAAVPGYDAPEATVYYNALTEQVAQVLSGTTAAAASATLAESWAVGGTGTREGENTNNAQYWAQQAQSIAGGQLGWYETEQALQAAHPNGENGQWAIIGSTDTIWTWDSDTSAWVNSGAQVDLSNYYTKDQANAAFATAAQGTKADSAVQTVDGQRGPDVVTFLPGQFLFAPYRVEYGDTDVNSVRHPWVNADDDLDKTVYAALYARVGDSLSDGAADGFFNCRRLTGRFTVAAGGDFSAGSTGGAASHTLTQEELPKLDPLKIYHSGGSGSSYFSHPLGVNGGGGSTTISRVTTSTVNTGYADLTVNLGGKSQPFQTLPPYMAMHVHVHT